MSTLEFVSTSADGIAESHAPLVTASALVAALGTQPTLTLPLAGGRTPDIELIWARLHEVACFFGAAVPPVAALADALRSFLAEVTDRHGRLTVAACVMVAEIGGRDQFVVSGSVIDPVRTEPVVLMVTPAPGTAPTPHWRLMAGHTASHAERDRAAAELRGAGYADSVPMDGALIGRPLLGALLVDSVGVGADRLELLSAAGLLDGVTYSDTAVSLDGAKQLRWVSPDFEIHPVSALRLEEVPA